MTTTEGLKASTSDSLPPITIFSSIDNIGKALRECQEQQQKEKDGESCTRSIVANVAIIEIVDTDALNGYGATVIFEPTKMTIETIEKLNNAEILITEPFVLAKLLKYIKQQQQQKENGDTAILNLSNLRWCQSTYAGVDPLFAPTTTNVNNDDKEKEKDNNQNDYTTSTTIPNPSFILTRFAGVFGRPIAEWCIGRIIEYERNFNLSRIDQSNKQWVGNTKVLEYRYLSDLTLGILGCGDIGTCIAKSAKYGFNMNIIGYKRSHPPPETKKQKTDDNTIGENGDGKVFDRYTTSLQDIFQNCDYIVSVLPSTNETRGLLTPKVFSYGGNPSADGSCVDGSESRSPPVFINVGRGDVIAASTIKPTNLESNTSSSSSSSSNTICNALNNGNIRHAILDVFDIEPLPDTDPLWNHPNVTISPHISGLTRSTDVPKIILDNYHRYVKDKTTLKYQVNWNKTY